MNLNNTCTLYNGIWRLTHLIYNVCFCLTLIENTFHMFQCPSRVIRKKAVYKCLEGYFTVNICFFVFFLEFTIKQRPIQHAFSFNVCLNKIVFVNDDR